MIFTLLVVMFTTAGVYAQIGQGTMMVGGNAGFSSIKYKQKQGSTTHDDYTMTTFSLAPQFGYFVIDNLAVGGDLNVSLSKYSDEDTDDESKDNSFELRPFVRYYLPQKIFFHGQFGIGSGSTKDEDNNKNKYNLTSWNLGVGYAIFITNNIAIEPMIKYGSNIKNYKDANPDYKDINTGLSLNVGFQIYLRK